MLVNSEVRLKIVLIIIFISLYNLIYEIDQRGFSVTIEFRSLNYSQANRITRLRISTEIHISTNTTKRAGLSQITYELNIPNKYYTLGYFIYVCIIHAFCKFVHL